MRAAIVEAPGKVSVTTVPDPTPGRREVVVKVASCGLCGTDLHILQGEFAPTLPIVPGHEFAGEIVGVGADVTELAVGDRVAVDPSLHCHECRYCRSGRGNLCDRWAAIGVTVAGGAAEFAVAPVANCVRLPEHIDVRDAALIEPLSCAVRGYDVLRGNLGVEVLIYGSGTMGLMMLELAKRTGAAAVDVLDVNPDRLATADLLGCSRSGAAADELDQPRGWDVVIDATGNARAIQDGIGRVAKGGTFLQFGVADYATTAVIEPYRIYNQEITIAGSMAVLHSFERAAALFAAGVLDPAVFISDRLPLEQYPQAIDQFKAGQGRKIVVQP
ncbi:zinc-dependent alcohol dehydrogenase family protein [Streptomyces fulvorobeus]|uniref:2-deoxy-scyllo-inosamine dehydrogenase n=1 Tax=Streptomyces fulvorobeus TaxID=284028 RepID=A0A7J0CFW5_9ACTN|nr:zinc-dependent alcohol dehydrogenase family protein [Streptomyces fulvorobeus]NYE44743.1 2-desacetyl-2-hydroxyethyl bacteriochlorophyllide A dehydrogenase [Streptomyces fulvorobeus]GFN01299.1 alcohol dehydrogenase [Streptomyces fulvorobeus]